MHPTELSELTRIGRGRCRGAPRARP